MQARRAFVEVPEGQIHYRYAGHPNGRLPLLMLHPGPASSKTVEPLLELLGESYWVLAPDELGMGDSSPPAIAAPDVGYFAESTTRFMDAVGIQKANLWGSMTGANTAVELARCHPERVNKLYIETYMLFPPEVQQDLIAHHAPQVKVGLEGLHFNFLWHFARDQSLFFPWFRREAKYARKAGLPRPVALHEKFMEMAKSARTFHVALNATLRYPAEQRLREIDQPVIGPKTLAGIARNFTEKTINCGAPLLAEPQDVAASAREIIRHLDAGGG